LPIIFVTAGMGDAQLQFKGYELGAVDYLIKPFEPHILQSKVSVFRELHCQRRKLERAHQEQLFNAMREGYVRCKMLYEDGRPADCVCINANSIVEQTAGIGNIAGLKVSEIIPGICETNPEAFAICGRVAATGNPEIFEMHLEQTGQWYSVSVYSTEKSYFVAMIQDITERELAKQEMLVMNNQLTHEVAKRTSDLAALTAHIQNIAEAERARIARELHDELGSALVGMAMEVGHLKGKTTDATLEKGLSAIKELISSAIQIQRNVINQLYPNVLANDGFASAVEWLVKEFRLHSGIEIELLLHQEQIDMQQTFALAAYRITQECLTNIAKHAGASKVLVEAGAEDGFLDLTIHDNGKGLPAEVKNGGHGIFGMMERARYLGGSMEIGSEDGKGTTARLRIPLAEPKPKSKKRVLVVDDHAIVRDALRRLLGDTEDFSVDGEAADGKAAVQMAIDGDWDVMLLDISLPKKNGLAVLEDVMAVKPGLPVIMLSSYSQDVYGDEAVSKGAACYLEKGETDKLVESMRRVTLLRQAA
jgi:signal transduction histidine kinase/DNA-binding response OmpR family regulator